MKTIFITSFHGHISRNILATDVLTLLKKERAIRIVVLAPAHKINYFRSKFQGGNIMVEGVILHRSSKTRFGLLFKRLGVFLFDSHTTKVKRHYLLYHYRQWFRFAFFSLVAFAGHSRFVRRCIRTLDMRFSPKGFFGDLIETYRPDLVFSTDIQNEDDVSLMQDARARGIPIIGMVRSWDNMTQRACRIFPDRLLVGSTAVRDEAIQLHDFPLSRIGVVGNPHYDRYLRGPITPRAQFMKALGLDPKRRLIMYNPIGDPIIHANDTDVYIMGILGKADAQVLVRLPTNLPVKLDNFRIPENTSIDQPGFSFRKGDIRGQEITREDDDRLIDSLYYSDLVVSGPSSICLDAAFFDKPIIAVDFYPTERHFFDGVYAYGYEHLEKLLATGGVHRARTREDFLRQIQKYLREPELDVAGRRRIRELWFSHADGRSSERLVQEILSSIH